EEVCNGLVLARLPELLVCALQRVVVGDSGRSLDHLGHRPIGHAFSVGEAAAAEHRRAFEPVDELPREPALAYPGLAVQRDEGRVAVANGRLEGVLEQVELGLAADERRLERPHRAARLEGSDDTADGDRLRPAPQPQRRPRPPARPRTSVASSGSSATRPRTRRAAVGPMTISFGPACCSRRAARLTASPVANVDSDSSATTSPDSIPMRTSRPSSPTRSRVTRAARTARSASSSCWSGTPKAAITASPANFATVPPCVVTQCETWSK